MMMSRTMSTILITLFFSGTANADRCEHGHHMLYENYRIDMIAHESDNNLLRLLQKHRDEQEKQESEDVTYN